MMDFWRTPGASLVLDKVQRSNTLIFDELYWWKKPSLELLAKPWKSSSQEHTRPPRIQEENFGFDSRYPISGYDLTWEVLWNHYLTSRKPCGRPQTLLLNPLLEGKMEKKVGSLTGWFHCSDWAQFFFVHPGYHKCLSWTAPHLLIPCNKMTWENEV